MRITAAWLGALTWLVVSACRVQPPRAVPGWEAAGDRTPRYWSFDSGDELAAYLRGGSDAGVLVSAHRGGPADGYPENALATFERTLGYGPVLLEVDVRMSRDSVLVLMHDSTLERTSTGSGRVADHTFTALRRLLLRDARGAVTAHRIPTLDEALAWSERRAVLMLDVKPGVPPVRVVEAIRRASAANRAVIIGAEGDVLPYHRLHPGLVVSANARTRESLQALLAGGIDPSRMIAFLGVDAYDPEVLRRLSAMGVRASLATFRDRDHQAGRMGAGAYCPLVRAGIGLIATDSAHHAVGAAARCTSGGGPNRGHLDQRP
jgi:glycerophosphoryl diester phosphodiesterase